MTMALAGNLTHAALAAVLVGGGLATAVVGILLKYRTKQRTLAAILDDTMGQVSVPVEVASESPPRNETSALTVRLGNAFGRFDTRGHLERRLDRASIPFKPGEYMVVVLAIGIMAGVAFGIVSANPLFAVGAMVLVFVAAWKLPARRSRKRAKMLQKQLPDALSLMAASVEGGQTFQRAIDMYRRDARAPLSEDLDQVMAEIALGSDLVTALENMADRAGVEDLTWAVEAVRIQQSTGGRLGPILHTLAEFMRMRQEVRREVQTLTAEGRISAYVLFALPLFVGFALLFLAPGYLDPMFHGIGLVALLGTAGLMGVGFWIVQRMVNIEI